jgi:hypothetical protein
MIWAPVVASHNTPMELHINIDVYYRNQIAHLTTKPLIKHLHMAVRCTMSQVLLHASVLAMVLYFPIVLVIFSREKSLSFFLFPQLPTNVHIRFANSNYVLMSAVLLAISTVALPVQLIYICMPLHASTRRSL